MTGDWWLWSVGGQELSASLRAEGDKAVAMVRADLTGETAGAVAVAEKDHTAKVRVVGEARRLDRPHRPSLIPHRLRRGQGACGG